MDQAKVCQSDCSVDGCQVEGGHTHHEDVIDGCDKNRDRLKKLLSDRWWRLNNLYYITNEEGKHIRFVPNAIQKTFYFSLWYLNNVLKARQMGLTTFIQIFILDACLFNSNRRAGVIAHNREDAEVFFRDKIKYAYEHLPSWLKDSVSASTDKANEIVFSNGSSIRVGTSMRSGTLQYLHVSELGKISRKYPQKAQEIKTGAFNAVHEGQFIFVESTAEGRSGLFYDITKKSRKTADEDRALNKMEFKFHFFPWWKDKRYVSVDHVDFTAEEIDYFQALDHEHGIKLKHDQKCWYALKARLMNEDDSDDSSSMMDMKQEYPSTPDEAFEVEIKGAYFGHLMAKARQEGRISNVPYEPTVPVNTYWDLGMNDTNCIWFHQRVGLEDRFIDYYENNGESLDFYANILKKKNYVYDKHYLPHDVKVTELSRSDKKSRKQVLESLGVKPLVVVERIADINEGINMVRSSIPSCWFDKSKCDKGIKALEAYQKQWDDKGGTYRNYPLHNWASNGADAFRQFSQGFKVSKKSKGRRRTTVW